MFRWVVTAGVLAAALAGCRSASSQPSNPDNSKVAAAMAATASASAGCDPARPYPSGDSDRTLASGGIQRTYLLHVPPAYDGSVRTPVVLLFHGYTLNARVMSAYANFGATADSFGFIAVVPNGSGDPQYWNSSTDPGPDDLGFVRDLLSAVSAQLCTDGARVYAAGYSNGGGMAQFAACGLPGQIAAVGLVASTYGACQPGVPVVAFHGTADPILPFEGASASLGVVGGRTPPVRQVLSAWAARLGCDRLPTISRVAPQVELSTFRRCLSGDGEALLYAVLGGGHTWPGSGVAIDLLGPTTTEVDASALLWQFFAAHRARAKAPSP